MEHVNFTSINFLSDGLTLSWHTLQPDLRTPLDRATRFKLIEAMLAVWYFDAVIKLQMISEIVLYLKNQS